MSEKLHPGRDLMHRVRAAFLGYGYDGLSMVTLAKTCGFTRRSLYNYFSNKEEAFRAMIRFDGVEFVRNGMEAGAAVRRQGGSALDIVAETINVRYGTARRMLLESRHHLEINAEAFRRCRDIMIEAALDFQRELERLLVDLDREGLLRIKPGITAAEVSQMLADAGRAVNQALPPVQSSEEYEARYRAMCKAILYGCATEPERKGRR